MKSASCWLPLAGVEEKGQEQGTGSCWPLPGVEEKGQEQGKGNVRFFWLGSSMRSARWHRNSMLLGTPKGEIILIGLGTRSGNISWPKPGRKDLRMDSRKARKSARLTTGMKLGRLSETFYFFADLWSFHGPFWGQGVIEMIVSHIGLHPVLISAPVEP